MTIETAGHIRFDFDLIVHRLLNVACQCCVPTH